MLFTLTPVTLKSYPYIKSTNYLIFNVFIFKDECVFIWSSGHRRLIEQGVCSTMESLSYFLPLYMAFCGSSVMHSGFKIYVVLLSLFYVLPPSGFQNIFLGLILLVSSSKSGARDDSGGSGSTLYILLNLLVFGMWVSSCVSGCVSVPPGWSVGWGKLYGVYLYSFVRPFVYM